MCSLPELPIQSDDTENYVRDRNMLRNNFFCCCFAPNVFAEQIKFLYDRFAGNIDAEQSRLITNVDAVSAPVKIFSLDSPYGVERRLQCDEKLKYFDCGLSSDSREGARAGIESVCLET